MNILDTAAVLPCNLRRFNLDLFLTLPMLLTLIGQSAKYFDKVTIILVCAYSSHSVAVSCQAIISI